MSQCPLDPTAKNKLVKVICASQIKILIKLLLKLKIGKILEIRRTDSLSMPKLIRMAFVDRFKN
jgi:hypothetical protein